KLLGCGSAIEDRIAMWKAAEAANDVEIFGRLLDQHRACNAVLRRSACRQLSRDPHDALLQRQIFGVHHRYDEKATLKKAELAIDAKIERFDRQRLCIRVSSVGARIVAIEVACHLIEQ